MTSELSAPEPSLLEGRLGVPHSAEPGGRTLQMRVR